MRLKTSGLKTTSLKRAPQDERPLKPSHTARDASRPKTSARRAQTVNRADRQHWPQSFAPQHVDRAVRKQDRDALWKPARRPRSTTGFAGVPTPLGTVHWPRCSSPAGDRAVREERDGVVLPAATLATGFAGVPTPLGTVHWP